MLVLAYDFGALDRIVEKTRHNQSLQRQNGNIWWGCKGY
jgi:hypothetical protein